MSQGAHVIRMQMQDSTIMHAYDRYKGGFVITGCIHSKMGDLFSETLQNKYLEGRDASIGNLPTFENCPDLTVAQATDDVT